MGNYVEQNLNVKEEILLKAELHPLQLVVAWMFAILLIPIIPAIKKTLNYFNTELAVTNKRVIGKAGFIKSAALDAPLNKIQSVSVASGFGGKIFGYGNIKIQMAGDSIVFCGIKKPDEFKKFLMNRIEEYDNERIKLQAEQLANAMKSE